MKRKFTILGLALSLCLSAQSSKNEKAINYLNSQVECNIECIVNPENQDVINADILDASLDINLGNKYNDVSIYSRIILKSKSVNAVFETKYFLLSSPEFIQALNKNFKLLTEEDGIKLRSLFFKFDDESRSEFFTIGDKWYFIRSEFFGDISGYVVSVDGKGNILNIVSKDLEVEKAETCMGSASNIRLDKPAKDYLAKALITEIENTLKEEANYSFELEPLENENLSIQLYNGKLFEEQVLSDGVEASSEYSFIMLSKNDNFSVLESKSQLFSNLTFQEDVRAHFKISTNDDAQVFQDFVDQFLDVEDEHKKFYNEDDIWVFVREESFGDLDGLLVSVNENGGIKHLDECQIDNEHMIRLRMKDEDFIVDYAFKLEEPTSIEQTIADTEEIPVKISFNADMVNAAGAWILTRDDGKDSGFSAATTMESPFTDEIPGEYLGEGNHKVEYLLIPHGQDTSSPLGSVLINVTVTSFGGHTEGFQYEQERELAKAAFECLQNADLEAFSSYCASSKRLKKMLKGMSEETEKEKSIKDELSTMDAEEMRNEAISGFKSALEMAKTGNVNLKDSEFPELGEYNLEFEVFNLKFTKVSFRISTEKGYMISAGIMKSNDDVFFFDYDMVKKGY